MQSRITRRTLAVAALGLAAVEAQTLPATPELELEEARKRLQGNLDDLKKVKLPIATEPAFQFKA